MASVIQSPRGDWITICPFLVKVAAKRTIQQPVHASRNAPNNSRIPTPHGRRNQRLPVAQPRFPMRRWMPMAARPRGWLAGIPLDA